MKAFLRGLPLGCSLIVIVPYALGVGAGASGMRYVALLLAFAVGAWGAVLFIGMRQLIWRSYLHGRYDEREGNPPVVEFEESK